MDGNCAAEFLQILATAGVSVRHATCGSEWVCVLALYYYVLRV